MKAILTRLFNHEELTSEETKQILLNITKEMYPEAQIAALLTAFQMRSITVDELIGFREALMETRCACFVVAGAGYKVAKHGNYGATSVSGASNVIEQHGVRFTNNPDTLKRSMEECNIAYLHAQLFNPAMKFVGPVRKTLGVRTLFNLLGPLVNPCCPAYQLLGVADLSQMRLYTNVFYKLGIDFAVVNSLDSYDEISLTDEFKVMTRNYERIYRPQALGFKDARPEELFGGACKEDAARIFDNILTGHATPAQTQCVIVNAAFAIQVMEPQKEIEECIAIARESLDSGRALATLKKFIEINK